MKESLHTAFAGRELETERIKVPLMFQLAWLSNLSQDVVVTANEDDVGVTEPVRPVMVTAAPREPAVRSKLEERVKVNRFVLPETGVLCWIVLVLNSGTTTLSGAKPPLIPYLSPVALVKSLDATVPMLVALVPSVSVADTLTVGDD